MKYIKIVFLIFLFCAFNSWVFPQSNKLENDQCIECHSAVGEVADLYKTDVHYSYGISCAGCHGGDSKSEDQEIAMSKARRIYWSSSIKKIDTWFALDVIMIKKLWILMATKKQLTNMNF